MNIIETKHTAAKSRAHKSRAHKTSVPDRSCALQLIRWVRRSEVLQFDKHAFFFRSTAELNGGVSEGALPPKHRGTCGVDLGRG